MKIEVYIPDHEEKVVAKILELKKKRKLSSYIVEMLRKENDELTREQIIELIKQYSGNKKATQAGGLEESIQSILGGF